MPWICCIIFWGCHKHNSLPFGPIQPSSSSIKELHDVKYQISKCLPALTSQGSISKWTFAARLKCFGLFMFMRVLWEREKYNSVWPDWAKSAHFGRILKVFLIYFSVNLGFGKMLNLLWQLGYFSLLPMTKHWRNIKPSGLTERAKKWMLD